MTSLMISAEPIRQVAAPHAFSTNEPMKDGSQSEIRRNEVLAPFVDARPRLFGIAYRMLGSAAEAEDIVQDAWLRWQATDRSTVAEPSAFLATITMRLAINLAESARLRRETYGGAWIPEPANSGDDPYVRAERVEALEIAVLVLLEKLTPAERAAYVLREAFDYSYGKIAEIVQSTESNTRQLVSRARKHINSGRRAYVSTNEQHRFFSAFLEAAQKGNPAALEGLLQNTRRNVYRR